jgi:formamidopyrimidine-DNA glycosylase
MPELSEVEVAARNLRRWAARRRARVARADNHAKRIGARCPRCKKGTILRIVQAQRATFFCPRCQK